MRSVFVTLWIVLWTGLSASVSAQQLGGLARFDPAGSSVSDVWGGAKVSLSLSQGVPFRVYTLADPNRLVVDFREVDWQGPQPQTLNTSKRIGTVQAGRIQAGLSRLVAMLDSPMTIDTAGLKIDPDGGNALLTIALTDATQAEFLSQAGAPPELGQTLRRPKVPATQVRKDDPNRPLVIAIDPGHGGIDPGAQNGSATEADLMLAMARALRETLLRAEGFQVVLTRETDVFVSLEARVALAHTVGADLFVSLHADSLAAGRASGSAVYTLSEDASDAASADLAERHNRADLLAGVDLSGTDDQVAAVLMDLARLDNTPRSTSLAQHMVAGILDATGQVHKRPLRQARFSVLKSADIPSVLVEVGFLSTAGDLERLRDPEWRALMAAGLRDGIIAWATEDAALKGLRLR